MFIIDPVSMIDAWHQGYKTFSMLNSVEHENLNVHKYINIKKFSFLGLSLA